jgi:dTDP-4-dehydrorhamnose 3,5-epimerase
VIFRETELAGAWVVELERHADTRGFFARSFCAEEFGAHGLCDAWAQSNVSYNARRGTVRGMHWQVEPHQEVKLVRCTAGALHDVIVDLRAGSPTLGRHVGVRLDARNRRMLYVPAGFAHGFVTLEDDTEVFYEMSHPHAPGAARGFRYDDRRIGIDWPEPAAVISDRDAGYPDLPDDLSGLLSRPAEEAG